MPKKKIEIIEKNIEDTDNSNQIVEPKTDDNSIQKSKPKRVQSQKQKDAFAKLGKTTSKKYRNQRGNAYSTSRRTSSKKRSSKKSCSSCCRR